MAAAIEEARKSRTEPNKTPLFVGAVVVKDGQIIARGHRGEHKLGEHAEYTTLERNPPHVGAAANATLYCTLEPCIVRNLPKSPCAEWIKRHRIDRVVIGVIDPNRRIRGGGVKLLRQAGIDVALFPKAFANEIEAMNSAFEREHDMAASTHDDEARDDETVPLRGFSMPSTIPDTFFEWRRWENPTSHLEEATSVFDRAWLDIDGNEDRTLWDVCATQADAIDELFGRLSAAKAQLSAAASEHRAKRYVVVVATTGAAPGDAERGAAAVARGVSAWPAKIGISLLVGWVAKHHFVTEMAFHDV